MGRFTFSDDLIVKKTPGIPSGGEGKFSIVGGVPTTPYNDRDYLAGTIYSGSIPNNKEDISNFADVIQNRVTTLNKTPMEIISHSFTEVGRDSEAKFEPFLRGDYSKGGKETAEEAYRLADQILAGKYVPKTNYNKVYGNGVKNDYDSVLLGTNEWGDPTIVKNRFGESNLSLLTQLSSLTPTPQSSVGFEQTSSKPGTEKLISYTEPIPSLIKFAQDVYTKGLVQTIKNNLVEAGKKYSFVGKSPEEQIKIASELVLGFSGGLKPVKVSGTAKVPIESIPSQPTKTNQELLPKECLPQSTQTILQASSKSPSGTTIPQLLEKANSALNKLNETIKTAVKPGRKELETVYSAERSKRVGAVAGIQEKALGLKGTYQSLGKLKGELAPTEKKVMEKINLAEDDIDALIKVSQLRNDLPVFERLNTQTSLLKVLNGVLPTNSELSLLQKTYGKQLVDSVLSKRTLGEKIWQGTLEAINLPRTLMSSFDLSAPFRQGLFLISHPKTFGSSFIHMFKQFASEKSFKAVQEAITKMPEYSLMKESKLALTDMDRFLTGREEAFMSTWGEKIPIVGKMVRASNRAYIGFLNKLRADTFADIVRGARISGKQITPELGKQIADFVNTASGRGGKFFGIVPVGQSGVFLNGIFFSPRLMASRTTLLNPLSYIKADPVVRKEYIKSMLSVAGAGMTVLGLAKLAGAEVGDDSNSSDFGKIKIGNTRVDIWGGMQQYIRMFSQLLSGKYVSTTSGKETTLGEGYKPLTRLDIVQRQLESKTAPVLSFIVDILRQQDYSGKPIQITNEVTQRFIPMVAQDIYDIVKDNPSLLPIGLMGLFGVGSQTYQPTQSKAKGGGRFKF